MGPMQTPNALQYKRAINSVIIGQNVHIATRQSNVGKYTLVALPYSFVKKQPIWKRSVQSAHNNTVSKIKVIRM